MELDLNIGFESCNNSFMNIVIFHNSLAVTVILVNNSELLDKMKKFYI